MIKEFVPYEQSLELKELGFDEKCFAWHDDMDDGQFRFYDNLFKRNSLMMLKGSCAAPLYQQAFRWFREKHGLIGWVEGKFKYKYCIESTIPTDEQLNRFPFRKHEEAELECLKKLIEIVKSK